MQFFDIKPFLNIVADYKASFFIELDVRSCVFIIYNVFFCDLIFQNLKHI